MNSQLDSKIFDFIDLFLTLLKNNLAAILLVLKDASQLEEQLKRWSCLKTWNSIFLGNYSFVFENSDRVLK